MGVQVNEARTDDVVCGVDNAGGVYLRNIAAMDGDALVIDRYGTEVAGTAAAVDDESVFDEQVYHIVLPS